VRYTHIYIYTESERYEGERIRHDTRAKRANARHTTETSFVQNATLVGCCSAVYLLLVLRYAIPVPVLGLPSGFGRVGLLGDGVGAAMCVADAEREVERVWWRVCKLRRLLMVCKHCKRGELCEEESDRGTIPAPAFDTEHDDGLRDDIEEDIDLDEEIVDDAGKAVGRAEDRCTSAAIAFYRSCVLRL
jgi:hypothetical protein